MFPFYDRLSKIKDKIEFRKGFKKDPNVYYVLWWFPTGFIGLHRFYINSPRIGIIYIVLTQICIYSAIFSYYHPLLDFMWLLPFNILTALYFYDAIVGEKIVRDLNAKIISPVPEE